MASLIFRSTLLHSQVILQGKPCPGIRGIIAKDLVCQGSCLILVSVSVTRANLYPCYFYLGGGGRQEIG